MQVKGIYRGREPALGVGPSLLSATRVPQAGRGSRSISALGVMAMPSKPRRRTLLLGGPGHSSTATMAPSGVAVSGCGGGLRGRVRR